MQPLNLELDLELNSDVDKDTAFNYMQSFKKFHTPREELDVDSQADQHKNNLVDPHDHSPLAAKQELSQGDRPLCHAYVEDADDSSVEQTGDDSQRSVNVDVWPPSGPHDTYDQEACQEKQSSERSVTSSIPQRLDTPQHPSSKRKQRFEDGGASKRARIELADANEGEPRSSSAGYPTRWTYEEFALRYHILVPSSSRTSDVRDMAITVLTRVLGTSKSEGLDTYQLGLTEIFFSANSVALLENLRTMRLDHYATMVQKNLKAKYSRRKYLEVRKAISLIQSVTRRHLAWEHTQETRRIKAATAIQRVWRGQKQRKNFNAIRNNIILTQAAVKGFLQRREIMDTRVGEAAVLIQTVWRLRRHMKSWRQYRRKVVIVQSLWWGYMEEIEAERAALKMRRRPSVKERYVDLANSQHQALPPPTAMDQTLKAALTPGMLKIILGKM
ncbi:hypothetical protein EG329_006770 [Mollisiaceae sp. DMI_Dod_QoI]|nr:hypothetical protein EG329_006770 [Helotiales sp. DMI_Dod_QoI]